MNRTWKKRSVEGFVLIEVLTAFLIVSVGIAACAAALGRAAKASAVVNRGYEKSEKIRNGIFIFATEKLGREASDEALLNVFDPQFGVVAR